MSKVIFIIASLLSALSLSGCKDITSNKKEVESPKTSTTPKARSEKAPGCKTLIEMDHLSGFHTIETSELDLDQAIEKYAQPIRHNVDVKYLRNVSTINSCHLHQIHIKNIPQSENGYKQVIFSFMEDASTETKELMAAGMKITCWSDENEQWHAKSSCN